MMLLLYKNVGELLLFIQDFSLKEKFGYTHHNLQTLSFKDKKSVIFFYVIVHISND